VLSNDRRSVILDKSGENGTTENLRREAVKQYMHYFRFWFLAAVILLLASIIVSMMNRGSSVRGNQQAPAQRVYDEADVLSQEEEELLSDFIAKQEVRIRCDIVLVTIKEDIEGIYGDWYSGMRTIADDFYDSHGFGYDTPQGDGMLLVDNWEEGQMGSWLSTCGAVEWRFGDAQIDKVLDEVDWHMPQDPYGAYYAYVEQAANIMAAGSLGTIPFWLALLVPLVVMVVFVAVHLRSSVGKNTVAVTSYVTEEQIHLVEKRDAFIRKQVLTRRIPKNNGGGSGHGGGHHISGGGVSHGGGGRRR
jgi:uncharacterized protein